MEETGNKGLGSSMQSDTSLHDSALKWWNGCEANTLPFNEGSLSNSLLFSSFSSNSGYSKTEPVLLPPFSSFLPARLAGLKCRQYAVHKVNASQISGLPISVGSGWWAEG